MPPRDKHAIHFSECIAETLPKILVIGWFSGNCLKALIWKWELCCIRHPVVRPHRLETMPQDRIDIDAIYGEATFTCFNNDTARASERIQESLWRMVHDQVGKQACIGCG